MYFTLLKNILSPNDTYNIYIDIKDTNSSKKSQKLRDVLANSLYDFNKKIVKKIQPIRSHETQIMQVTDLLIGACCNHQRRKNELSTISGLSDEKLEIINKIKNKSKYSLDKTTLIREKKMNLFFWEGNND